jgi:Pyruvate/2-oxoacid:ferredoxin oxidoreductase delta subunit
MRDAYALLAEKLGYARSERLTKVLKRLMDEEEAGLIHDAPNCSEVASVICNRCTDCCVLYYAPTKHGGLEKGVARSRFQAEVDKATCNGCQIYVERCPFEAIEMERDLPK